MVSLIINFNPLNIFYFINIFTAIFYGLPVPLLPILAYSRGVNESLLGIIFAIYSVANLIIIPYTNTMIDHYGRTKVLYAMTILKTFSSILYISLFYIYDFKTFVIIAIIARTLQGLAVEIINIIIFSLCTLYSSNSSEDNSKNLSIAEGATSLGYMLSPVIAITSYFGYIVPFYICIFFDILNLILIKMLEEVDLKEREVKDNQSLRELFCNRSDNQIEIENIKYDYLSMRKKSVGYFIYFDERINELISKNKEKEKEKNENNNINNDAVESNFLEKMSSKSLKRKNTDNEYKYETAKHFSDLLNNNEGNNNDEEKKILIDDNKKEHTTISDVTTDSEDEYSVLSEPLLKKNNNLCLKYDFVVVKNLIKNDDGDDLGYSNPFYFLKLLGNLDIFITLLVVVSDYTAQSFFAPVFTIVMFKNFGLNEQQSSLILTLMFFCYFISLRFISVTIKMLSIKFLLFIGLVINGFSSLLMNPSRFLPQELWISILGYCIINSFAGFVSITSIIDFNRTLRINGYAEDFSSDTSSAIYIFGINIAELIAPTLGGVLTNFYGFEYACYFVCILNFSMSLVFLIFNFKRIINTFSKKSKKVKDKKIKLSN